MAALFNLAVRCVVTLNAPLLPLLKRWMEKGNGPEGNLLGLSCSYLCHRPDEMHRIKTRAWYFSLICEGLGCTHSPAIERLICLSSLSFTALEGLRWLAVDCLIIFCTLCRFFFFSFCKMAIKQTESHSMWTAGNYKQQWRTSRWQIQFLFIAAGKKWSSARRRWGSSEHTLKHLTPDHQHFAQSHFSTPASYRFI